jgi:hypothetical protein
MILRRPEHGTARIGRRELLELLCMTFWTASGSVGAALAGLAGGCSSGPARDTASGRAPRSTAVELWSFFDLPAADPRSRDLSGIAWDPRNGVLWAIHDASPSIVALVPDATLHTWRFGETMTIDGGDPADLEGIALVPDGFVVCSEDGPRVMELDRRARFQRRLSVPSRFGDARKNKGFESLTVSPSGRYLFTTTEVALVSDGPTATNASGTRVRILRIDRHGGAPVEYAYETDASAHETGDWGVSDLEALSDTELLVLERGWSSGHGNTVRIYDTTLEDRARCSDVERLSVTSPVLSKTLRADLSKVPAAGVPEPKQPQPAPLLDNYEGMALGPRSSDGRRTLLLVSDDNGHATQVARIVVLVL